MLSRVTINNQRKLIESQVNSRAIAIYYHLYPIAFQVGEEGVIYDFNIHKIFRLLISRGIKTTYRQVKKSIKELIRANLIYYPYTDYKFKSRNHTQLRISNACEFQYATLRDKSLSNAEQIRKIHKTGEKASMVPHVHLNACLLSNEFYKLGVSRKRGLIYIYNGFANKGWTPEVLSADFHKDTNINIRKPATRTYIKKFIHLNNETKIHQMFEELEMFFISSVGKRRKVKVIEHTILN